MTVCWCPPLLCTSLKAILSMMKVKTNNIKIQQIDVSLQHNGTDQGIYAIANAQELCAGRAPASCSRVGNKMRVHLLKCLDVGMPISFPKHSESHPLPLEFCTRKPSTAPAGNLTQKGRWWLHAQCVVSGFTKHAMKFLAQFSETKIESHGHALHATNN